jgi:hypothetical protein
MYEPLETDEYHDIVTEGGTGWQYLSHRGLAADEGAWLHGTDGLLGAASFTDVLSLAYPEATVRQGRTTVLGRLAHAHQSTTSGTRAAWFVSLHEHSGDVVEPRLLRALQLADCVPQRRERRERGGTVFFTP